MPVHTHAEATAFERALRALGGTRPGSWFFSHTLHRLDRVSARWAPDRPLISQVLSGLPVGMLTTTGAKSGLPRPVPLVIVPIDGGWAVIASSFGRARHPAWRANLLTHPTATLELDGRTHPVRARLTHGEERAAILRSAMAFYRGYAAYARRASQREIDIFGLRPVSQFEQR